MLKEFKEFAFKGNLVDMAVGIILGGAFATVAKSLVENVVMPPVGLLLGGVDLTEMKHVIKEGAPEVTKTVDGTDQVVTAAVDEVAIRYGQFITDTVAFIVLAFVVFIIVKKVIDGMNKQEEEAPAEPPRQEVLLEEILVEMKKKS